MSILGRALGNEDVRPSANGPEREVIDLTLVDDPEFVLGVRQGATEDE
jgi:hypothetical protein